MAHCGLRLYVTGSDCPAKTDSIFLEHNEEINAIEWSRDLADAFRPMGLWNTADATGKSYGQNSELSNLDSGARSPTIFELLYELFARDSDLQAYSISKKNCCHFARAAAAVLLLPADLSEFDALLQDPKVLDKALKEVMGSSTRFRKWLVKSVGAATGTTPDFKGINAAAVNRWRWRHMLASHPSH